VEKKIVLLRNKGTSGRRNGIINHLEHPDVKVQKKKGQRRGSIPEKEGGDARLLPSTGGS